jgi:hypothetical protein
MTAGRPGKPTELKRLLGNPGREKLPDKNKVIMLPQSQSLPPTHLNKTQQAKWIDLRSKAPCDSPQTDEHLLPHRLLKK